MKDVFIIGSKGIPARYGGFETFVDNLVSDPDNKEIKYHVSCLAKDNKVFEYKGAECFNVRVPNIGPAKAVLYDVKAFNRCLKMINTRRIEKPIVYVLACRMGPFISKRVQKLHTLGGIYMLNPDGHEWLRAKWNYFIKKYWKYSERMMIEHADLVVCDSVNIEKYVKENYAQFHPKTTYIAYGADTVARNEESLSKTTAKFFKKNKIQPDGYYLIVGRFVPENNYEIMIREFMASKAKRDLVIVSNAKEGRFYHRLQNATNFESDPRIKFVGTVYNQEVLSQIRFHAHGYLHGHEVGGTNPSLLEALATTNLNLLLDVGFNKEVGENAAFYWSKEKGNLASLLEKADCFSKEVISEMGIRAKARIDTAYSWEYICEKYRKIFVKH